jgi:type III pantothenate kinase
MLLTIDIGNTNIVFGIYDNNNWLNHWRIQTDQLKTADEYEVIFRSLLTAGKISRSSVKRIVISSVVPSLVHPFQEMLQGLFEEATNHVVSPDIYPSLPIKILNPYQIGADLVAVPPAFHRDTVGPFQSIRKLLRLISKIVELHRHVEVVRARL